MNHKMLVLLNNFRIGLLESVEEAIDLMAAIRCAIGYMLKEIPVPVSPLVAALLGTPSAVSPQLTNP